MNKTSYTTSVILKLLKYALISIFLITIIVFPIFWINVTNQITTELKGVFVNSGLNGECGEIGYDINFNFPILIIFECTNYADHAIQSEEKPLKIEKINGMIELFNPFNAIFNVNNFSLNDGQSNKLELNWGQARFESRDYKEFNATLSKLRLKSKKFKGISINQISGDLIQNSFDGILNDIEISSFNHNGLNLSTVQLDFVSGIGNWKQSEFFGQAIKLDFSSADFKNTKIFDGQIDSILGTWEEDSFNGQLKNFQFSSGEFKNIDFGRGKITNIDGLWSNNIFSGELNEIYFSTSKLNGTEISGGEIDYVNGNWSQSGFSGNLNNVYFSSVKYNNMNFTDVWTSNVDIDGKKIKVNQVNLKLGDARFRLTGDIELRENGYIYGLGLKLQAQGDISPYVDSWAWWFSKLNNFASFFYTPLFGLVQNYDDIPVDIIKGRVKVYSKEVFKLPQLELF